MEKIVSFQFIATVSSDNPYTYHVIRVYWPQRDTLDHDFDECVEYKAKSIPVTSREGP
jgi:hypothetical protein